MKKSYIAPELKLSEGQQCEVLMLSDLEPKVEGEVFDQKGNSHGTIGWGGFGNDNFGDAKHHGWDVFGGEE